MVNVFTLAFVKSFKIVNIFSAYQIILVSFILFYGSTCEMLLLHKVNSNWEVIGAFILFLTDKKLLTAAFERSFSPVRTRRQQ